MRGCVRGRLYLRSPELLGERGGSGAVVAQAPSPLGLSRAALRSCRLFTGGVFQSMAHAPLPTSADPQPSSSSTLPKWNPWPPYEKEAMLWHPSGTHSSTLDRRDRAPEPVDAPGLEPASGRWVQGDNYHWYSLEEWTAYHNRAPSRNQIFVRGADGVSWQVEDGSSQQPRSTPCHTIGAGHQCTSATDGTSATDTSCEESRRGWQGPLDYTQGTRDCHDSTLEVPHGRGRVLEPAAGHASGSGSNSMAQPDPPPPPGMPQAPTTTPPGPPPQQIVLAQTAIAAQPWTSQRIRNLTHRGNIGGRQASIHQKELRKSCILGKVWGVDLTDQEDTWPYYLRSMDATRMNTIVGPLGIKKFTFKLLPGVKDANYMPWDSGEKHVFEATRVDESRVQLHYHKNGKLDDPTEIPRPVQVDDRLPRGGLTQPAPVIGRPEVANALMEIMTEYCGSPSGRAAVDITGPSGFDWRRWLGDIAHGERFREGGVEAVFVVQSSPVKKLGIAICRPDGSAIVLKPEQQRYTADMDSEPRLTPLQGNWRDDATLKEAPRCTKEWLQIREARFARAKDRMARFRIYSHECSTGDLAGMGSRLEHGALH